MQRCVGLRVARTGRVHITACFDQLLDDRGGVRIEPGGTWRRRHRITRVVDLPVLGPGLYARVRRCRISDGTTGGRAVTVGALFEVERTNYEMRPVRSAERDGDVATLVADEYAESRVVLEHLPRAAPRRAVSLVPEAVGVLEIFRDSIPLLGPVSEVRVVTSAVELVFELLAASTVRDIEVGRETRFELDGTVFAVGVESA